MRLRSVFVTATVVVLLAGCSGSTSEDSPTPSRATFPTSAIPEASPTIGWDLGETVDLTWTVQHNGRAIGVVGVGHTNDVEAGIEAAFEPATALNVAAESVGASHFNWYQYLVEDTDPPKDAGGNRLQAPFVDPPCGGYGGRDRDWSDHLPWYWDETEPPRAEARHADPDNQLDENIEDETLFLSDAPGGANGTELSFRTYLTGVPDQGDSPVFLGGFGWSVEISSGRVKVGNVERLVADEPAPSDFEGILAGSSCPA